MALKKRLLKIFRELSNNVHRPVRTVSGHQRLRIAENVERRGQAVTDPIKKSRIANLLKEYWGVKQGRKKNRQNGGDRKSDSHNAQLKTTADIAEASTGKKGQNAFI